MMSEFKVRLLGFFTFLPIACVLLCSIPILCSVPVGLSEGQLEQPDCFRTIFVSFFWAAVLDILILMVVYIVLVCRDIGMTIVDKTKWIFYLLFFQVFAIPLYWYYYIWNGHGRWH